MDNIEISLLTCSPGNEIWSLYGHTAIHLRDTASNQDVAINYGMFSFQKNMFVLRFVFGLTDYEMGIVPFSMFLVEYAQDGRSVIEQHLNLSAEEKMAIVQAIYRNYEPANRVYRYNYFYDNCTTRARDILVDHLNGQVEYVVDPNVTSSYRKMIHQWTTNHRWARFGNDLLLGLKADFDTDYKQQQFLPDSLRRAFATAMVVDANGKKKALVDSTHYILKANAVNSYVETNVWDSVTPTMVFAGLLVLVLIITVIEWKKKKVLWLVDTTLLTLDGLAGLILLAMVFSQHPTVSVNAQILLLNPLSIIFVYSIATHRLKGYAHVYWKVLAVCITLFAILGIFQSYAEGMYLLALTLLIRCCINIKISNKTIRN